MALLGGTRLRLASASDDKSVRMFLEITPSEWHTTQILSNSRSLSFTKADITNVTASGENKVVLKQYGAVTHSSESDHVSPISSGVDRSAASGRWGGSGKGVALADDPAPERIGVRLHDRAAPPRSAPGLAGPSDVDGLAVLQRQHTELSAHVQGLGSRLTAVQDQQALLVGAIAAQDAVLARILSLLSPAGH